MTRDITAARAIFIFATLLFCTHCARHSASATKPMHGDGKAVIAQGPGSPAGRKTGVTKAEREVPGLAPIVQAPGRNDDAMLRTR